MQNELTVNTVEWWLNQITDPIIKRLALGNMDGKCNNKIVDDFECAIGDAFIWSKTKEGRRFWAQISERDYVGVEFESVKHLLPENYVLTN